MFAQSSSPALASSSPESCRRMARADTHSATAGRSARDSAASDIQTFALLVIKQELHISRYCRGQPPESRPHSLSGFGIPDGFGIPWSGMATMPSTDDNHQSPPTDGPSQLPCRLPYSCPRRSLDTRQNFPSMKRQSRMRRTGVTSWGTPGRRYVLESNHQPSSVPGYLNWHHLRRNLAIHPAPQLSTLRPIGRHLFV